MRSLWVRRPDATKRPVDGLRALSVLWVIEYHTLAFIGRPLRNDAVGTLLRVVNRGHLGVDSFFVLSGFLIAWLLMREHEATGSIGLRTFYRRRAMRILPAYFVALAIHVLLIPQNRDTAWANVLFVNNFLPEGRQCMSWTWSLAVEEQFYIVFPLALLIALRISRPLTLIVVGFAVSTIVRMAIVERYGIHLPRSDHQYLFSNMLYNKPYARFPQLLSGAIVAYLAGFTGTARRLQAYPVVTSVVSLGALVAIVALSSVKQPVFRYGWPTAANFLYFSLAQVIFAVAVAAMLFVSLSGLAGGRMASRLLSWRGFYPVSQLSYSAYLIHMIIIFVGIDLGVFPLARSEAAVFGYLLVIPAVTLIAAMPLYMLVEKPMMNLRERQSK